LQTADPFAYADSAFAFPQRVSDCACKLQIPLLMLILPLPSLFYTFLIISGFVFFISNSLTLVELIHVWLSFITEG
jgi:hypothetical protein